MRLFLFVTLSLLWATGAATVRAQEDATKSALQSANRDVQTVQTQLHQERKDYLNAVHSSGQGSPQALAAKTRLDATRESWRTKLAQRQTVRRQARRELMHHRDTQHPRHTAP